MHPTSRFTITLKRLLLTEQPTTDDATLTTRAEAARRRGDFPVAIELYRQALETENSGEVLRARLAGLLEHTATEGLDQDLDRSLALYQEAWATDPTREKLRVRYSRALRRRMSTALIEDDKETAVRLLEMSGHSTSMAPLLGHDVEALVDAMPLPPLSQAIDSPAGKWLVLLDGRLDVELLPALVKGLPPSDLYSIGAPAGTGFGDPFGPVLPIDRAASIGFETESAICEASDGVSLSFQRALRKALPPDRLEAVGIDVLDHLSFAVDDVLFRTAKELFALSELAASGRYALALVVSGDGVARSAIQAVLAANGSVLPAWEIRCSEDSAYDPSPHPLPARDEGIARHVEPSPEVVPAKPVHAAAHRLQAIRHLLSRHRKRSRCVLVATPNLSHTASLVSVAARLDPSIPVTALPLSGESKRNIAHSPYRELAEQRSGVRIDESCAVVLQRPVDPLIADAVERSLADVGETVAGMDLRYAAAPMLARMLTRRIPGLQELARRIDRFLGEERPRVLLVSPDRAPEVRVACTLARRHGATTVFPQMAFFSRSPRYKPPQADLLCVLDDHHRRLLEDTYGTDPSQVEVTGIPRFDTINERRAIGLREPPGDGSVLLVLQSLGTSYNELLTGVLLEAVRASGSVLRVKLHPRDSEASLTAISRLVADALPDRATVYWQGDVHDLVLASDVIVTTFSNVVLEAAMLERPVICANLTGEALPVPFVEQGLAFGAESADELSASVARAVTDPGFRREIRDQTKGYFALNPHLLSGRASDRVASLVNSLAGGRGGRQRRS